MEEGCNKGEERGCKQGGKEAANKVRKRGCKKRGKRMQTSKRGQPTRLHGLVKIM